MTHMHVQTYIYKGYVCSYTHTYVCICMFLMCSSCVHICMYRHTYIHTQVYIYMNTCRYTHMYVPNVFTYACTDILACTCRYTHPCARTHTYKSTLPYHTLILSPLGRLQTGAGTRGGRGGRSACMHRQFLSKTLQSHYLSTFTQSSHHTQTFQNLCQSEILFLIGHPRIHRHTQ